MPESARTTHSGDIVTDRAELTLDDLCKACGLRVEQVTAYVEEGIIEQQGSGQSQWRFSRMSLIEVRRANRLERDLGLNAAGVALALDLMSQIETLKRRVARFEQEKKARRL